MAEGITKRGRRNDGSTIWRARYRDPEQGGTAQIEKLCRTEKEAKDWLTTQGAAVLAGTHISPKRAERRFSDLIEAWRESWPRKGLQPQTTARYEQILRTHINKQLGHRKVKTLTHEVIQRHLDGLRRDGMSPGMLRKVHTALSGIFKNAVKMGSLPTNPCYAIELPRAEQKEMVILEVEEIVHLAEALPRHWTPAVYTAAYTGLRAGELWALTRKDIDPLRGTIRVEKGMRPDCTVGPTKTHERRTITANAKLMKLLENHMASTSGGTERWPAVRKEPVGWALYWTEDAQNPERLVFLTPDGTPVRHRNFLNRQFRPAVQGDPANRDPEQRRAPALPPDKQAFRWHDLRHTHASLLINEGASIVLVSKRLGHKSTKMTLDTYTHLYPSAEAALAQTLDNVFTTEAKPSNVRAIR